MKIIFSLGDRIGAGLWLASILPKLSQHEIKIAAFNCCAPILKRFDWTLDACSNPDKKISIPDLARLVGYGGGYPFLNIEDATTLWNEIQEFAPDLIICDAEIIFSRFAKLLNIPLWYVSPVHILDRVEGNRWGLDSGYTSILNNFYKHLTQYPDPDRYYILSPWGWFPKFHEDFTLKPNTEWLEPEVEHTSYNLIRDQYLLAQGPRKSLNEILPGLEVPESKVVNWNLDPSELSQAKWCLTSGETQIISKLLATGVPQLAISPDLEDPESVVNSIVGSRLNVNTDLGQIELMGSWAVDQVWEAMPKTFPSLPVFERQPILIEKIHEYACSL